jgi:hypothetical protein
MSPSLGTVALVLPADRVDQLRLPPHLVIRASGIWQAGRCLATFGKMLDPAISHPFTVAPRTGLPQPGIDVVAKDWRQWISVFSRFADRGDQYDLWVSEIAVRVQLLAELFQEHQISAAVFSTGVSHHMDTMLIQEGLRLAGVPQVHLYSVVINGRLLPLLQSDGIEDRRPLGLGISTYDFSDDLANFKLDGAANPSFAIHQTSRRLDRVRLALTLGMRSAKATVVSHPAGGGVEALRSGTYGLGTYSRQMWQVSKARQTLSRLEEQDRALVERLGDEAGLIVMAHFQPEATSYAEAGLASNHVDLVAAIRAKGWKGPIVYREHPAQWRRASPARHLAMARSAQYYSDLQSLGCLFQPSSQDVDPTWLRERRLTPVTMTGSIALERALKGWSTVVTGYPWFVGLPGTLSMADWLLNSEGQTPEADVAVAQAAEEFLRSTLNQKTLTNAPGIGTGATLDESAWRQFEGELARLMDGLSR